MKLVLMTDDGEVLDSADVDPQAWINAVSADRTGMLSQLSPGDEALNSGRYRPKDPDCAYTMSHTRAVCGMPGCGTS